MYGKFIETVGNKGDKYGFVDEIEVRIGAGLALVFAVFTFYVVIFLGDFSTGFLTVGTIWLDFLLRVFVGPDFSIFGRIVRPFIENKEKVRVGSVQKRFAWSVGLFLSTFVLFCMLLLSGVIQTSTPEVVAMIQQINTNISNNAFMVVPMNPAIIACVLCTIFMFLESVFGICVGCKMYKFLVKKGIMKKHEGQNCVNGSCEV